MAIPPAEFVRTDTAVSCSGANGVAGVRDLVLLVEDDDTVASLFMHILKRAGRQVVRARDRAECLESFRAHAGEVALAILDFRLPDCDGAALCRELRAVAPELPMLLTSGRDHSRDALFLQRETTVFLQKPFRPVDVEAKIASLLGAVA